MAIDEWKRANIKFARGIIDNLGQGERRTANAFSGMVGNHRNRRGDYKCGQRDAIRSLLDNAKCQILQHRADTRSAHRAFLQTDKTPE